MKPNFFLNIFLLGMSLLLITSCCNYNNSKPDFYITEAAVSSVDGYAEAQISVHKRGFWFLWCIPFKRGCEAYAKDLMEKKAKEVYPGAAVGIAEYRVTDDINMSPFTWITGTKATGKIILKQGVAE